jgi:glycine/D-amino acid oxidase-like deaminating enzyme
MTTSVAATADSMPLSWADAADESSPASQPTHADVVVLGDGVLGLSIAFALADSPQRPVVALVGKPGPGASRAAGAMLSVLGELTATSLRTPASRERVGMTLRAAQQWPAWRQRVRASAGAGARDDGYRRGTFMILNSASSTLDQDSIAAMESFAGERNIPAENVDPRDIPGYWPFDRDRAIKALYFADEPSFDARGWLATLESALQAMPTATVHRHAGPQLRPDGDRFYIQAGDTRLTTDKVVVAAGAWTPHVVAALAPDVEIIPVVSGGGTALRLRTPASAPAVVRTPNRAFGCGLHLVPQADGTVYLGATNNVTLTPEHAPTLANLHHLTENAVDQFHQQLTTASLAHTHFGNRPVALDGYPLLGATSAPGLWVATGTFRDGIQLSPFIAEQIAADILTGDSALPQRFKPCRALLTDWDTSDAIDEAARHLHAVAVETRLRPPIMGDWPQRLHDMYAHTLTIAYAALPSEFVLPPELAPLAYEHGRELATLLHATLSRTS